MTTIKKMLIINCFRLPEVVIDIIKEYVFLDIGVKIWEQRLKKKEVDAYLSKDGVQTSYMLNRLNIFVYRLTNNNPRVKKVKFCKQCGNFYDPNDYQSLAELRWEQRHHLTRYDNYDPRIFENPFIIYDERTGKKMGKIMLCICQEQYYWRNNEGAFLSEDYKCDAGYNYRKWFVKK